MVEEALRLSNYSNHHPIPIYGFRLANTSREHDSEDRQRVRRRVEMRALVAERAVLERRAQAGGGHGAAFARAISRRATARAKWVQKVISKFGIKIIPSLDKCKYFIRVIDIC